MTKLCTRLNHKQPIAEFYKNSRYADGYQPWCRSCKQAYARENPQHNKNWVADNPNRVKASKDKYVAENPMKVQKSKAKWSQANPKKELAKTRKYQASKMNATPSWLTKEQVAQMVEIYVTCPKGYEVDHIVPLQGKNVKGLHVPWNLQHLRIKPNRQKSNKF